MAVLLAGGFGAYYLSRYEPGADSAYDTGVASPALAERRPRVLFDAGHNNVHSLHGRYKPFGRLISSDGCRVSPTSSTFKRELLQDCEILVVVNAKASGPEPSAFAPAECDAVRDWVKSGGSLLLVADHHPCGQAAAELADRFDVEMLGGWTDDESHARAGSGDPGQLLFTREAGLLAEHPITGGHPRAERVATVETFTGQSLKGPPDSTPLLLLSDTAMDRIPVSWEQTQKGSQTITTFKTDDRSAAGRCQGLAMRFGKGRVVVLAEAAMLTAQIDDKSGRPFGMNALDNENRAFALNVIRWLAGALDDDQ